MYESLPLTSRMILHRWTNQAPRMLATLETSGQLLPALNQANEQVLELLYQLTIVRKMDYNTALEMAMNEWSSLAEPVSPVSTFERDFRFASTLAVGTGALPHKAGANLEAIRLLKALEQEQRPATDKEKLTLVRYTGWGALPQVFQPFPGQEWETTTAAELTELLTDTEYAAARASTPNAHYTPAPVIKAIWDALIQLGATSPLHILEPALGIGHFFGLMPEVLHRNAVRVGIELDAISARIAQRLYPDSNIRHAGFETATMPNGFFDLVIGNVPFGNYSVYDPQYRKQSVVHAFHS